MIDFQPYQERFDIIGKNKDNVVLIHDFMDKDVLQELTQYLDTKQDDDEFLGGKDLRLDTLKIETPELARKIIQYEQKIYDAISDVFTKRYGIGITRKPINTLHFVKWIQGMSSGLHADCQAHDGTPASAGNFHKYNISILMYPNDNYVGGEITFPDYDIVIKPRAGDLVIFPGNNYYKHTVEMVESGVRYTMPSWYSFDVGIDVDDTVAGSYLDSAQLWPDDPNRDLVGDKSRDAYLARKEIANE